MRVAHTLVLSGWTTLLLAASASSVAGTAADASPYATECGGCHVAYPAKSLSRSDWSRVLGSLGRHYGVDASLDAGPLEAVALQLGARPAASGTAAALPRITAQPWFREEHREVDAWFRSRSVGSAANCSACHTGAERGDFDEHSIRMPR